MRGKFYHVDYQYVIKESPNVRPDPKSDVFHDGDSEMAKSSVEAGPGKAAMEREMGVVDGGVLHFGISTAEHFKLAHTTAVVKEKSPRSRLKQDKEANEAIEPF